MTILAIDTTSQHGSLAIRRDGLTAAEVTLDSKDGFGHLLFPAIDEVLRRAHIRLQEIDCFAGASGPGAFTGVRVDVAAVKGMAEVMRKPAVAISNLRAVSTFGSLEQRAVLLDARRGEIYAAVYDSSARLLAPEAVLSLDAWLETLDLQDYQFVSQDSPMLRPGFAHTRFEESAFIEAPRHLASAVAVCAELDGQQGRWLDPAALDANYVRHSDAQLPSYSR